MSRKEAVYDITGENRKELVESQARILDRVLEMHEEMRILCPILNKVVKTWTKNSYDRNKWSRCVTSWAYNGYVEINLYIAKSESVRDLLSFFEALESQNIVCKGTVDNSSGRVFEFKFHHCNVKVTAKVVHSETCELRPVYEYKKIQVGTKVVCG